MTEASARDGLFQRRSTRIGLVAATALYLFLISAAFLSREPMLPAESLAVFGPTVVRSEGTFPIRWVGFAHGEGRQSPVMLTHASLLTATDEAPLALQSLSEGIPGAAHLSKAPERSGPFEIALDFQTAEAANRRVLVPMAVFDEPVMIWPAAMGLPDEVPKQALQIEVLTEGPGLSLQTLNRVWFRVTDTAGKPVSGATVSVQVSGATPGTGVLETDPAGLASLMIRPNNLTTRFVIDAKKGDLDGHQEQTEQPLGRAAVIRTNRMIQAKNEGAISLAIVQAEDAPVYCDLLHSGAWVRSWHLQPQNGEPPVVQVHLEDDGVYQFQCYSHFARPGTGGDALYLFRTHGSRLQLTSELLRHQSNGRTGVYRKHTPVVGEAATHAVLASFRTKEVEVVAPALLANTRRADVEAARVHNDTVRARFMLLIGASFGMVVLWAVYIGIQNAIESRVRLAEAIAELGEMAVDAGPLTGLVRARTVIQIALIVLILALNIVGMLALYQVM